MSNNIYDILKKMQNLEAPKQNLTESKKAKPDYIDIDKDGNKTEPMKKAVREKSKGAVAEAVAQVERQLNEKYMGFKKTVAAVKKGGSADDPEAVAAAIGRKKYGKEKFQKAAAAGKKLGEGSEDHGDEDEIKAKRRREREPDPDWDRIKKSKSVKKLGEEEMIRKVIPVKDIDSARDYKHAQEIINKIPSSRVSREELPGKQLPPIEDRSWSDRTNSNRVSREELPGKQPPPIEDRSRSMKEGEYNEDMLSPKQKKFAALAEPKDKITYADKIAGAKKGVKKEGNKFSGNLMKARAKGLKRADLDGDGDMEQVHEWGVRFTDPYPGEVDLVKSKEVKDTLKQMKPDDYIEKNRFDRTRPRPNWQEPFSPDEKLHFDVRGNLDSTDEYNYWSKSQRDSNVLTPGQWLEKGYNKAKNFVTGKPEDPVSYPARRYDADPKSKYYSTDLGSSVKRSEKNPPRISPVPDVYKPDMSIRDKEGRLPIQEKRTSMREGWEEMQKYLEKKRGPESKGGEGKKAGTRYGGSAQQDDSEDTDGEGQAVVKKKGRPKGTGGGAKFSFKKPKD